MESYISSEIGTRVEADWNLAIESYLCSKKHVYCTCIPRCENAPSSTASGTFGCLRRGATIFIASLGIWRRNFLTLGRERPFACVRARARIDNARERESKTRKILSSGIARLVELEPSFFFVLTVDRGLESLFIGITNSFDVIT